MSGKSFNLKNPGACWFARLGINDLCDFCWEISLLDSKHKSISFVFWKILFQFFKLTFCPCFLNWFYLSPETWTIWFIPPYWVLHNVHYPKGSKNTLVNTAQYQCISPWPLLIMSFETLLLMVAFNFMLHVLRWS